MHPGYGQEWLGRQVGRDSHAQFPVLKMIYYNKGFRLRVRSSPYLSVWLPVPEHQHKQTQYKQSKQFAGNIESYDLYKMLTNQRDTPSMEKRYKYNRYKGYLTSVLKLPC